MPAFGIDWLAPVRSFRNFFGTYGTTSGSIRGVLNAIVPVAVVDRYRDDDEGSTFAMTITSVCAPGNHAAISIGSITDDWELLDLHTGDFWPNGKPTNASWLALNPMIYTPDSTYQPVVTPSPAGFFVPGLNPDWSFTLGSVTGIAGYNPTPPSRFGFIPQATHTFSGGGSNPNSTSFDEQNAYRFDPPIRVYRDVSLGVIWVETFNTELHATVSIRYRIRPRTTDGPRTG